MLLLLAASALAQTAPHQRTAAPPEARFELLQSSIASQATFRVDKFTGRIWQMVAPASGDAKVAWRAVSPPEDAATDADRVNYQVFTSALTPRHTFLINVHTGATWVLREAGARDNSLIWVTVPDAR